MSRFRLVGDDAICDGIAGQAFESYDAAYAVLERYYGDLYCSDDLDFYRIEVKNSEAEWTDGPSG
jgi:hypothetical protein